MDYQISVKDFKDEAPRAEVTVEADDWYSALLSAADKLNVKLSLTNLSFTLLPDGLSAEVNDPNLACWFLVKAVVVRSGETTNQVFVLHWLSLTGKHAPRVVKVLAGDWFTALQEGLLALGETPALEQVSVKILADNTSAKVVDPNTERCYIVQSLPNAAKDKVLQTAEVEPSHILLGQADLGLSEDVLELARPPKEEVEAVEALSLRQFLVSWSLRYAWLWMGLFILGAVPFVWLFNKLELPAVSVWELSITAGVLLAGWAWSILATPVMMKEFLQQHYWQYHQLFRKAGVFTVALVVWAAAHLGIIQGFSVWIRTLSLLLGFGLLLVTLFRWSTGLLLYGEVNSNLSPGTVMRWSLRITTVLVALGVTVGVILFAFIGGMHWWHANFVTSEVKQKVKARHHVITSLQLKSLEDRKGRSLGLFQRTRSDWSSDFNEPELLNWPISKTIMIAEGRVQKPAWWWRYLPDGHRLMSEPFSVEGFLRIPYYFLRQRRKVGGSTPTLQAAKNFEDYGASRKGKGFMSTVRTKLFEEIPRSYVMSQVLAPRDMLATYMATLWIGHGDHYGLHRMGLYFFGVAYPSQLTWNQAAVLASSFPNPGTLNPWYLKSCIQGKCSNKRRARVFKVWTKRIRQLKRKLRRRGINVPKALPKFYNGLRQLRVLSRRWLAHDIHLRKWIRPDIQTLGPRWAKASTVQLSYDREMTLGPRIKKPAKPTTQPVVKNTAKKISRKTQKKPAEKLLPKSLVEVLQTYQSDYRKYLPNVQVTYTLLDARDGGVASQFGGEEHFDMAEALKPVVGSTFKVLTLLVADDWPERLPLLNRGRGTKLKERLRRRFLYQQVVGKGDFVRNSHAMPPFVSKRSALTMSANIGFVFLSLRWTWMVHDAAKWNRILKVGLIQLYQDRLKLTEKQANRAVDKALQSPTQLYEDLNTRLGYAAYLKGFRKSAAFEAAKAETVRTLLRKRVSPQSLSLLLGSDSVTGLPPYVQRHFHAAYGQYYGKFRGDVSFESLSWLRPLRMELGLRYLIHVAKAVAGYSGKRENLQPVMTTTLGVNNASTMNLARVAAVVAKGGALLPTWIKSLWYGDKPLYKSTQPSLPDFPVTEQALTFTKQAMNSVLRWGTAGRAGSYVLRSFGIKTLKESGAKTGTVQDSRGVSCVGFLEHRAGAVTISTPNNLRLKRYFLRSWVQQPLLRAQSQLKYVQQKQKLASSESAKKRAHQLVERATRLVERATQKVKEAEDRAQAFLKMGKIWKKSLRLSERHQQIAARRSSQAQFVRRQVDVYQRYSAGERRMIQRYQRWFERFHKRAKEQTERTQRAFQTTTRKDKDAQRLLKQTQHRWEDAMLSFERLKTKHNEALRTYKQTLKTSRVRWQNRRKDNTLRRYRSMYQFPELKKAMREMRSASKLRHRAAQKLLAAKRALNKAKFWAKIYKNNRKVAKRRAHLARTWKERKPSSYVKNVARLAHNRERLAKWQSLIQANEAKIVDLHKQRDEQLAISRKWVQQSEKEKLAYQKVANQVAHTHSTWQLNSSQACMILFRLLGYWKRYESSSTK